MTEADRAAVDDALQINPVAMAEAEGHLQKGLMMLTKQIGLTSTASIVTGILTRLQDEMPLSRAH